jgi:type 1 glutamine amidotransferase
MNKKRFGLGLLAVLGVALIVFAQQSTAPPNSQGGPGQPGGRGGRSGRPPGRKVVLAWADTRNGIAQHDSVSHALAIIERIGYESGVYDTYIRTDSSIISKHPRMSSGQPASGGPNLNNVDAIFCLGHREIELDAEQKADLLSFIKDDGKGFVAAHTASNAFMASWPEFGEMLGGRYDNHPWGTVRASVINEDPAFPATRHLPAVFDLTDEFYQTKDFTRENTHVVLRLDTSKLPANQEFHRTDGDFPLAWAKTYGKGRVFYSSLGHDSKTWDNPDVYRIYFEALKWALKLTDADITPRPLPAGAAGVK